MRARTTTSIIATALAAGLALPGPAAAADCANADAAPGSVSKRAVQAATLCLLNEERAERGLRPLREHRTLRVVARRYSAAMVRGGYFSHVSPTGSTPLERVQRTRYLKGARRWKTGENLAAASGSSATPARIVDAWMASTGHRRNILDPSFREIGIGVAYGTPTGGRRAAVGRDGFTFATTFGMRRR